MTLQQIEQANKAAGGHWFDQGATTFFKSRVSDIIYQGPGGIYFVSSEKDTSVRFYTVRKFDPNTGMISTHGKFQQYATRSIAHSAAKAASK